VSCVVLGVFVGLLVVGAGGDRPATPTAEVLGRIEEVGDEFHVPVEVRNHGDAGATDVQVVAELTTDDDVIEADLLVDFLAGGERDELIFVFADDPGQGELVVRVAGFREP
jgi:uncharacterized protein (TIGR02588 family)